MPQIKKAENWQYIEVSQLSKEFAFPKLNTYPESEDIVINMTTSSGDMNKENFDYMLFRLDKTTVFLPVNCDINYICINQYINFIYVYIIYKNQSNSY